MEAIAITKENHIQFEAGNVTLRFDRNTGAWIYLGYEGKPILDGDCGLAPVTLTVGGTSTLTSTQHHMANVRDTVPIGSDLKLISYSVADIGEPSITLVFEGQGWHIEERFRNNAAHGRIERSFTITNHTQDEVLLRYITSRMPIVADERNCTLEMPGYLDVLHQKCSGLPFGSFDLLNVAPESQEPSFRSGLIAAVLPEMHMNSWMYGEEMMTFWRVYRGDRGVWFEQQWQCPARILPGCTLEIGAQYVSVGEGDFTANLSFMQDFWDEMGVALKQPTCQWAKESFVYEAFIGEKSFPRSGLRYSPYPTAEDLMEDLPRIRDLGFTILELMPHFPFPNYSVHDYYDVDVQYGPKESIQQLIQEAHSLGMHVFLDVVMHGVTDKTLNPNAIYERHPLRDEHPEFFIYTEDGRHAKTYTWSFDQRNTGYREYMKDVFCYYIEELDADGFRVDAIHWNFFPNWKEDLPYPAYKTMCASFGMFAGVRDAVLAIKPEVTFYTETFGPLMANSFDLFYNYDEVWLYECLIPIALSNLPMMYSPLSHRAELPAVDARGAAEWMDMRHKALPRDIVRVHHVDSHDSHEWLRMGLFRREYFGLRQTLALFAYCCFVDGAVMNFVGGEKGLEKEYAELMRMRRECKALLLGSCDYIAVRSDNRKLFVPLRVKDDEVMIPIINFSDTASNGSLDLSALNSRNGQSYLLTERFSAQEILLDVEGLSHFDVELEPYAYQLWQVTIV